MSVNTLSSAPTLTEGLEMTPEISKNVLSSFRSLIKDSDLVQKIEQTIANMDNGMSKQLMAAALRRVQHLNSSAEIVKENARERLQRLMTVVQDSQEPIQA